MATKQFYIENIFKYFLKQVIYLFYYVSWACAFVLNCKLNWWMLTFRNQRMNTSQLGRVLWKMKRFVFQEASPVDFLCIFRTRVKPEYVLRSNVSLYSLTRKEAIFVETPEDVKIFSSDVQPFLMTAQFINATSIIKMSIRDFVSLAEKIGDPTVPIIWVSSTGRCGGTMLCQMFESVPGTLTIHEPDAPFNLLNIGSKMTADEYELLFKAMVRITCKPRPGVNRICIKPRPQCVPMMAEVCKLNFYITQIFIYRHYLNTLRS